MCRGQREREQSWRPFPGAPWSRASCVLASGTTSFQQRHLFSVCTYLSPEPLGFEIRQPRSGGFGQK